MLKIILLLFVCLLVWLHASAQSNLSNVISVKYRNNEGLSNVLPVNFKTGAVVANKIPANQQPINTDTRTVKPVVTDNEESARVNKEIGSSSFPKFYALIIGVSEYKFSNQSLVDLDKPVKDAQALVQTLGNYHFENERVTFLRNPTRGDIIETLEVLSGKIKDNDNLLIFYAGHGYWDEKLMVGYWLPSDAQFDKKSTWLSNSNLKDYVAGIKSKHTLLITDACFGGSIFKSREVGLSDYGVAKIYKLSSRKAMTSGNLKTVPDQSKFFEYLNKRLMENDVKYLSSRELFSSLYNAVVNNTNSVPQYGVIQDTGDEGGDFIFIKKD
jgi:Caspase domain